MRTETDYMPWSELTKENCLQELGRLSKAPGFDSDDAETVKHLLAEIGTSNKGAHKDMLERLQDIYIKNYCKVKSKTGDRGVKIIGSEAPQKNKIRQQEKMKDLKVNRLYVSNGKHRGKQASRERKKVDKSVEQESATILLQV